MVSAHASGLSSMGSNPSQALCVVFLDKTLASLYPGVQSLESHPVGSKNIPCCFMLQKPARMSLLLTLLAP